MQSISNSEILKEYKRQVASGDLLKSPELEKLLRKASIRTLSGVAPVAVLTKAYPCPGSCAYCPHEPGVPVSYLSNEPAVMRAIRCNYEPYRQVVARLRALEENGHQPEKIELIVIGGTWSFLPKEYKYWYILSCFRAANDYGKFKDKEENPYSENLTINELKKLLEKEQKENEKSLFRLIGITLETRPDYINKEELEEMRELACTRVEIGVQAIDDEILSLNKRGHGIKEVKEASKLLRRYGFKLTYHFMPALPGSKPEKDYQMFAELFSNEDYRPDQLKFYPTTVIKGSLLYEWFKRGKYQPYSSSELEDLIIKCKKLAPEYLRIIRLIRDIPSNSIIAGNKVTNLRQELKRQGAKCSCIRCREAKGKRVEEYEINILKYKAAGSFEYFISADSLDHSTIYGFCRLRIDKKSPIAPALIRELHVYGELTPVGQGKRQVQHTGLGKKLLKKAEELSKEAALDKIAVISGVGVREYYRKQGYKLEKTYMIKEI